jgi:hypothetical protein
MLPPTPVGEFASVAYITGGRGMTSVEVVDGR